jgi:type I restriction enzyme S subunit
VPEGYKKTKVGIVPGEWKEVPLKEIMNPIDEKVNKQKLEVLSITAGTGFVNQAQKFGKQIAGEQYSKYTVIKKGDFAYNKGNSNRYPQGCIYRLEDRSIAAVPNVFMSFRINPHKQNDPIFYKYFFINGALNEQLNKLINSGVRNDGLLNLYSDDFYNCLVSVPSFYEQQKIAGILTSCDKVIQLKEKLIDEKRRQKKWLMEKLLDPNSGVRLPGFSGEWEEKTLGELGSFSKGFGISNADCETGDVPCIKYGDIYMSYNYYVKNAVSHTTDSIVESSKKIATGTLLFTGSGEDPLEIGKCVAYLGAKDIAVGGDIIIMKPHKANSLFLAYQQYTTNLIAQKAELAQGYSIVHIYADQIKSLIVNLPPTRAEQDAIANILFMVDNELDILNKDMVQWGLKKKALMQVLLTGIVRVGYN